MTDRFGLTDRQRAAADRVVAEESAKREHLLVCLSGGHACGFPSPDSGVALVAVHIAKTSSLLGLDLPPPTHDRSDGIDGVEVEYTSGEIAHVLRGSLDGNGDFIERVVGASVLASLPELVELRPLVRGSLSRRVHRHYRDVAANQRATLEQAPTIENLLSVLRTALTGAHLLRTGELETDVLVLADAYELRETRELLQADREQAHAGAALLDAWGPRLTEAFERLDAARERSVLPEEPRDVGAIEQWLISVRKARL